MYNKEKTEIAQRVDDIFGIKRDSDYGTEEVIVRAAYWRKANQIHRWFVQNVQGGKDECEKFDVSREQLQALLTSCKEVMVDHNRAKELFPTQPGFFFGSTKYDDGYFEDIESTIKQIERALGDPALKEADFYYQSSW